MIYRTNKISSDERRPRHDIDPQLKLKKDYALQFSRWIYSQYLGNKTAITNEDNINIGINRSYAEGKQDTAQYKRLFLDEKKRPDSIIDSVDPTKREGWVDMNFNDVFSPLPKYVTNIVGIMEDQEHDVMVDCIDDRSNALKEDLMYKKLIKSHLKESFDVINQYLGVQEESNEPLPASVQELDMYREIGSFKLSYEQAIEKVFETTDYISNLKNIKRKLIYDLIVDGFASIHTYTDNITKKTIHKRVDVENLIVENKFDDDWENIGFAGVCSYMTICDLRTETGWHEAEIESMAENFTANIGNPNNFNPEKYSDGTFSYDSWVVPIMTSYYKTTDSTYETTRINQKNEQIVVTEPYRGNKKPKIHNKSNRKTKDTSIRTIYTAKWVIGTERVFCNKQLNDIAFNYTSKDAHIPLSFYKVKGKSLISLMKPIEDQIFLAFLRFQNAIAKAPPPGIAIEVGSVSNIMIGGKKANPLNLIKMYTQSGNLLYQLKPAALGGGIVSSAQNQKPFEELRGGMGTAVADAMQTLELLYSQLSEITGIDRITSVSKSPTDRQGKAVTELAVASTSNTLKPIYTGYIELKQSACKHVALIVQSIIYNNKENKDIPFYYKVLGDALLDVIRVAGDSSPIEWGFKIIPRPTEGIKMEIRQAAQQALAGGKNGIPMLQYSEYLYLIDHLNTGSGIKYAQFYLAKKESEANMAAQQSAQQATVVQQEEVRKNEQVKAQLETSKIQLEKDLELRNSQELEMAKRETAKVVEQEKRETERMKAEYKLRETKEKPTYSM